VAKDRAAPFSRKHRKYWIPVTGGMILIGLINVSLGLCTYSTPKEPQRMELDLANRDAGVGDAPGTIGPGQIPAAVMREFTVRYPKTIPAGARVEGNTYVVMFPPGKGHVSATFRGDGTFVSEP
jgi:hypothetical protein